MKKSSKFFIVCALMCISAAAAYSQDCNSYLQKATELRDKGDYCQAKQYYQMFQKCNADVNVSTEIAMCVNRFKIQNPGVDCPDYVPPPPTLDGKKKHTSTGTSSDSRKLKPVQSGSKQSFSEQMTRFKLGIDAGVQLPMGDFGKEANMGFGGELNAKYMIKDNIGVGVGVGYYTFGIKQEILDYDGATKGNASIIPLVGKFSYAFGQNAFKPYIGADLGLYMLGTHEEAEGEKYSDSLSKFGFAPVIGIEYAFTKNLGLDVNAKYHYILTDSKATTSLGINVGIVFSF